jgi:mRNA interferase MazF
MKKTMPIFEPYSIVAVPFPYVERDAVKRRPALVVSVPALAERYGLAWVLMITSARNAPWEGDIDVDDLGLAGLHKPSVIRPPKIAAIEVEHAAAIGRVTDGVARKVRAALVEVTGLPAVFG